MDEITFKIKKKFFPSFIRSYKLKEKIKEIKVDLAREEIEINNKRAYPVDLT